MQANKTTVMLAMLGGLIVGLTAGGILVQPAAAPMGESAPGQAQPAVAEKATSAPAKPKAPPAVVALGDFLVNLHSADLPRYLHAEVALSLSGRPKAGWRGRYGVGVAPNLLDEGEIALARDRVVTVLSAAQFEQLDTDSGRDELRRSLRQAVNEGLGGERVQEVLFTSFVMQ